MMTSPPGHEIIIIMFTTNKPNACGEIIIISFPFTTLVVSMSNLFNRNNNDTTSMLYNTHIQLMLTNSTALLASSILFSKEHYAHLLVTMVGSPLTIYEGHPEYLNEDFDPLNHSQAHNSLRLVADEARNRIGIQTLVNGNHDQSK
jgi:hypothetical protein